MGILWGKVMGGLKEGEGPLHDRAPGNCFLLRGGYSRWDELRTLRVPSFFESFVEQIRRA